MTEQWKDIKGYEGIYKISNEGQVKKLTPKYPHGKILKATKYGTNRAPRVDLSSTKGYRTSRAVNRLVAIHFNPIDNPEDYYAMPKDGNVRNCHADNIEWVKRGSKKTNPNAHTGSVSKA